MPMIARISDGTVHPHLTDPFTTAATILGRRWALAVVVALLGGPCTFMELRAALPGLSANTLIKRLRQLSDDRVIVRQVRAPGSKRFEYALTQWGGQLASVREAFETWLGAVQIHGTSAETSTSLAPQKCPIASSHDTKH